MLESSMGMGMNRARALAAMLFLAFASLLPQTASAQRGNTIGALDAQIQQAAQTGHAAEGLALAQKLEGLVRRQQGTDNMNYAGVLHNEGMFLHNLGRYQEAVEKLNAALAIKLRKNDPESTLRSCDRRRARHPWRRPSQCRGDDGQSRHRPGARVAVHRSRRNLQANGRRL